MQVEAAAELIVRARRHQDIAAVAAGLPLKQRE